MHRHNIDAMNEVDAQLRNFELNEFHLIGLSSELSRKVFIKQLIDSMRRVKYVAVLKRLRKSKNRCDPNSVIFDPLRAALIHIDNGDFEEACWLTFLFVLFGKSPVSEWALIRQLYGGLNSATTWTWYRIYSHFSDFEEWYRGNFISIKGKFGNHRRYISLHPSASNGVFCAVESYVRWVDQYGSHKLLFSSFLNLSNGDPTQAFDLLFKSMSCVSSFGRLGRFDYLTMINKLGLCALSPEHPYLESQNKGPRRGANMLFMGENYNATPLKKAEINEKLQLLTKYLNVDMQVIEDSLCNWQKSRSLYRYFRG